MGCEKNGNIIGVEDALEMEAHCMKLKED